MYPKLSNIAFGIIVSSSDNYGCEWVKLPIRIIVIETTYEKTNHMYVVSHLLQSSRRSRPTLKAGGSGSDSRSRTPSRGRTGTVGDRFIPNRSTCDIEAAQYSIVNSNNTAATLENNQNGNNIDQG